MAIVLLYVGFVTHPERGSSDDERAKSRKAEIRDEVCLFRCMDYTERKMEPVLNLGDVSNMARDSWYGKIGRVNVECWKSSRGCCGTWQDAQSQESISNFHHLLFGCSRPSIYILCHWPTENGTSRSSFSTLPACFRYDRWLLPELSAE